MDINGDVIEPESVHAAELTPRQAREVAYHASRAQETKWLIDKPVALDVVRSSERRPWNGYWHFWDIVIGHAWPGRKVLVPGSGYGEDAIRMAMLGAEVAGFDISPESVAIAEARSRNAGVNIDYRVAALEAMPYPDMSFDAVLLIDILHHVDVHEAMREIRRVVKPGGLIFINELYTHDFIEQRIRRSPLIVKFVYPLMLKWIYGTDRPYITEDERKLNNAEFRLVESSMTVMKRRWFNAAVGRIVSTDCGAGIARVDRLLLKLMGDAGRYIAGRVVLAGSR